MNGQILSVSSGRNAFEYFRISGGVSEEGFTWWMGNAIQS